jgi:DNA-binding SARP family transcriptional activator/tetratricopeptide (TPR) repeat protein
VIKGMEFYLLGPLMVRSGGDVVPIRPGKERSVLAALLLQGNRIVSCDELTEILWGCGPPPSARVTLQNYVKRLRRELAGGGHRIGTHPGGYSISLETGELDVTRFEDLVRSARSAAKYGSWEEAAAQARAALALWRGEPLSDVPSELLLLREAVRLTELRLQALETRVDADLHLGAHTDVIAELRHLAGAHPLRERLHGLLMLALYRDDRQGEALAAYQDARRILDEEIGGEPGIALRELHQQILTCDPSLAVCEPSPHAAIERRPAAPRQLPAMVSHLTGRLAELEALTRLLDRPGQLAPEAVVISAFGGTAGAGETALAVRWAHDVTGQFPDGQLYVNLHGYEPGRPMAASDALAGFLHALGVRGQDIPPEAEQRAARYRGLLAGKRLLIVLDNAGSAEQIRPLLPGTPACTVVVTSRGALAGLVATDGATRLDLDVLPPEEAVALLRTLIGARVAAEPGAAAEPAEPRTGLLATGDRTLVPRAVLRTLPRDVAGFTGRRDELDRLAGSLAASSELAGIQAIGGMAGVGKTALAVHAAHRLAPQFPDGQMFVALHGHTLGQRPVEPAEALASLLVTAGIPGSRIPPGLAERAALWRDHLAGRRILLVLDDAVSSAQVEPLLPGAAGCLVLVTSRRHLTALEDARVISLDVFPRAEAADLLVRLAARPGLRADDAAVAEICALCGYLPLAIGMLARQLHHHPAWSAAGLAAELAAARDRLDLMSTENVSVAAGFALSCAALTADERRLLRRLGLHPGRDIDAYAAAALDDVPVALARRQLAGLYDHCLLTEPAAGRYRLHDLLREYAHALATREDPADDRDHALARLLDYYTRAAMLAESRLARQSQAASGPGPGTPPAPDLPDGPLALSWLRAERANLLACLDRVTRAGQHDRVVDLTAAVASLLRQDGPWSEAITRHEVAARAARESGDQPGQAHALNNLGIARELTGDFKGGTEDLEESLRLSRYHGDRLGQANALVNLGVVRHLTGEYQGAEQALTEALRLYHDLGDRRGQGSALVNLGIVGKLTGDYPGAARAHEDALGIFRSLGDRPGQADALNFLGDARQLAGDYPGAAQVLEEALRLSRDLSLRHGEGNVLLNLGILDRLTGDYPGAASTLEAALDIYREIGNWVSAALAANELGTVYRLHSDLQQAERCHRQALELGREIGSPHAEASALAGLGRCALVAGRTADARASLRHALEIFERIGAAETTGLATELNALANA